MSSRRSHLRERAKERAARGAPREAGVGGPWRGWKGAEVCRQRRRGGRGEDVESGRGRRAAHWEGPRLATDPLVARGGGRAHDSLGGRPRLAMLCRNIAAGWGLSVQRGRAKTGIWGAGAGLMTAFLCWIFWQDLGESMTKVGLWGIRFIADLLAHFATVRPGQTEALRDLDVPIA